MFSVQGGAEAVEKWPRKKYLRYRAYWIEFTRREYAKLGIDLDKKDNEDDDKPSWYVEEADSSPWKGTEFGQESVQRPRD